MRVTVVQTEKCSPMPIYGGKKAAGDGLWRGQPHRSSTHGLENHQPVLSKETQNFGDVLGFGARRDFSWGRSNSPESLMGMWRAGAQCLLWTLSRESCHQTFGSRSTTLGSHMSWRDITTGFPPACQSLRLCCSALGVLSASFWASGTLAQEEAPWLRLLVRAATHQHWFSTSQVWRWRHSLLLLGWDPLVYACLHRGTKVTWTALLRASSSSPEARWAPEGTTSKVRPFVLPTQEVAGVRAALPSEQSLWII